MPSTRPRNSKLFPMLLKHWRSRRGLSQLGLALAAGASARHLSFLETGRARPSCEMVLRLARALSVPPREQNALLQAAGHPASVNEALAGPVGAALDQMLSHHEPFPMLAMSRLYEVVRANAGAAALFRAVAEPTALTPPVNVLRLVFDPRGARPFITGWESLANIILARLHREVLERASDAPLAALLESLLKYSGVPRDWQKPDLAAPSEPCLPVRLRAGGRELAFLTTLTVFDAPQNLTLDELRIESYFPLDEGTRRACEALAAKHAPARLQLCSEQSPSTSGLAD